MNRLLPLALATIAALVPRWADSGAYVSATDSQLDVRNHPSSFDGAPPGSNGELSPVRVCLDVQVNEPMAIQAEPAVLKAINTINRFRSLGSHTLAFGADNDIPEGQFDFESTLLHEMLHALGLAHPNHADESGLPSGPDNGTRSTRGANNSFNQGAGADGLHGSQDDVRGDDVNLHWYQKNVNHPGQLPSLIDESTMARALNFLPVGHLFAANADRAVLSALGIVDAEAVAQQGASADEAQRHLQHDDLATLQLARAGLNGVAGDGDDYRASLVYIGRAINDTTVRCQINVRFDNSTGFAAASLGNYRITPNHWGTFQARLRFNNAVNWYFSPGANTVTTIISDLPDSSSQATPYLVRVAVAKTAGNPMAALPRGRIEVRDGARSAASTASCAIDLLGTPGEIGECEITPLSSGSKTLVAEYLGHGGFDASSDTEAHLVTGTLAFTGTSATPNPAVLGALVNFSWTLAAPAGQPLSAPTGVVVLKDAPDCASAASHTDHQCTVALSGNAGAQPMSCGIRFNSIGVRTMQLCYAGDTAYPASTGSIAHDTVAGRATTTTIISNLPNSTRPFEPVTVQFSVRETPDLGGLPTGPVLITDGPLDHPMTARCLVNLQGLPAEVGSCVLMPLRARPGAIIANFAANGIWSASSGSSPQTISEFAIVRNVPSASRVGQGVWVGVNADVGKYMGADMPSGTVTVTDGSTQCTFSFPANGCFWVGNSPGTRNLVASWPGDLNRPAMVSAPVSQTVLAGGSPQLLSNSVLGYEDSNGAASIGAKSLSFDGRWVVFASDATQLVANDSNGVGDIFVRDRQAGVVRRVSVDANGVQANALSYEPSISANGRFVAFTSLASNLVPGDTNNVRDIFVKDLVTGAIVRANLKENGEQDTVSNDFFTTLEPTLSADGRFIAFGTAGRLIATDSVSHNDIYVRDLQTGALDLVSSNSQDQLGDFRSFSPAISADGRYVAFQSQAYNFDAGDANGTADIFVKDRQTRVLKTASSNASGVVGAGNFGASLAPVISADGRWVAFHSYASNLVPGDVNNNIDVFVKDMETGAVTLMSSSSSGTPGNIGAERASISADGRYVAFVSNSTNLVLGDTNSAVDAFVKDRQTGATTRHSLNQFSGQLNAPTLATAISGDAWSVSFVTTASALPGDGDGLADLYVRSRITAANTRISAVSFGARSNGASELASISRDGRYRVFSSASSTLMEGDQAGHADVFLQDRNSSFLTRVSTSLVEANGASDFAAISGNGQWMAFRSLATNLVSADSNNLNDIFVKQQGASSPLRISTDSANAQRTSGQVSGPISLSQDGNLVSFTATDSNLIAGDNNGVSDILLKNRTTNAMTRVSTSASGSAGNGASLQAQLSDDGSVVVFASDASNLIANDSNTVRDVFVKTLSSGAIVPASSDASGVLGNGASSEPALSGNGRFVVFVSQASNLVPGDTNGVADIFVKDLLDGSIRRASVDASGAEGVGGACSSPSINANGRYIGFICAMTNLVPGDSNGVADMYVKDIVSGVLTRGSLTSGGVQANAASSASARAISDDGVMVFSTSADNLLEAGNDALTDVFANPFTVAPRDVTTTTITAHTPEPSPRDSAYTVSVAVARGAGLEVLSGTVRISEGSNTCNVTLTANASGASGQCNMTSNIAGVRALVATYEGDASYAPSTSLAVNHTVVAARPNAPVIGVAVAGNREVRVNFAAPADNGGAAIIGYTASCGAATAFAAAPPIVVTGLSNGVAVTCTVTAQNSSGTSPASAPSNSVTPTAAQTLVGPFGYVPTQNTGRLAIIDLGANTVIDTIPVGASPLGIAVSPDGTRAYVVDQTAPNVRVINTATRSVIATIPVGSGAWSAAVSPDGSRVFVSSTSANNVSVINTQTNAVMATLAMSSPMRLAVAPDGSKVYVGSSSTTNVSVIALPALTVSQFNVSTVPYSLALSPDGSRLYLTNGQPTTFGRAYAVDTATNTVVGNVQVGDQPLNIAVSPDGSRVYASNNRGHSVAVLDAASWTVISTVGVGFRPLGLDVHPNGSRVYVGNTDGTMSIIDASTNTLQSTMTVDSGAVYAIGNFIARASIPPANRSLAVGSITLPATTTGANAATRVFFPQAFSATPIVIVQGDSADADPKALRLSNINGASFDVLQVEPQGCGGCTGAGGATTVHWLAALPGSYRLADDVPALRHSQAPNVPGPGVLVHVGSVLTMASQRASNYGGFLGFAPSSWASVNFASVPGLAFAAPPVVLTHLQSWGAANEGANLLTPTLPARPSLTGASRIWLTAAVRNVTATGFQTALESSSSDDAGAPQPGLKTPETIGYVAIDSAVSTQLSVAGGSTVALATGTGTLTGCSNIDLSFPSGSTINAANLRAFAGLHSRNEDDGGWLRRCGLSAPTGNTVRLSALVDEDSDLKQDRTHATPESVGTAIFGGDLVTTPVSLAFVHVKRQGAQLDVRFGSATEAGHLAYRIWGRADANAAWKPLHDDVIVQATDAAHGDSMVAKSYQHTVDGSDIGEIRIEDIDILGTSRFHAAVQLDAQGQASVGAPALAQPLDWQAIRAANAASQRRIDAANATDAVLASVTQPGIQRANYAELVAAGFPGDANPAHIAVLENGQAVARYVECPGASFGAGCFVEWLGQPRASLYGSERVYEIGLDAAMARPVNYGALVEHAGSTRMISSELVHAPNRAYSFSAPGNDPWFDERIVATTALVEITRSFSLPARTSGAVNLSVDLWGGLDYSGAANSAPDHSVELLLNGSRIAREQFDGLIAHNVSVSLSEAQLQPLNVLTVRVLADTGYPADVVLLDGYRVRYASSSTVRDGVLQMGEFVAEAGANERMMQDGLESRSGMKLAGIAAPSTIWSQRPGAIYRDRSSVEVGIDARVSAVLAASDAQLRHPRLRPAAVAQSDYPGADYLIVTHPLFAEELQPLVALQQSRGYRVAVLRTDAIYADKSAHQRSPQAIREAIAQVNPRFVLLVGGDSYDYDNNLNLGSESYLPTFYRVASPIVRFAASDAYYADGDGNGVPERALGRLPARSVEELRRAIQATLVRGNQGVSNYLAVSGQSAAHEHFGVHSRTMLSYLRQGQSTDYGLSDEIGPLDARNKATQALAGTGDWISYLGHSSPNRWAFQNLLDTNQLAQIQRSGPPAIVSQWGCWNSYFVMPGQDTMSHALMLRSNTLAAAVLGSTSLAEDASHLALGTRVFDLLEDGRFEEESGPAANTLGEVLMRAKQALAQNAPEHLEANYSIVLFGDPAMPVR